MVLDAWPLTPNGKLDRAALPAPSLPAEAAGDRAGGFATPVEEIVAGLWREVLGLDTALGPLANFFELGGHSLLATQVMSRVRAAFGVEAPLRALFEAPTVRGLAAAIEQARAHESGPTRPTLIAGPRPAPLPLSFAQQRLWFLDQLDPGQATYTMPFGVRLQGPLDVRALAASLHAIVRRHEVLRTTFPAVDGVPIQRIAETSPVSLPVIDLSGLAPALADAAALAWARWEARQPFDLTAGPLIRVRLLRLAPATHELLVTLHHTVSDAWSLGILMRELTALYTASHTGAPASLAPLPVQYADVALGQRAWLQGAVLETQLAYWRTQLADVPALALPTDAPRPLVPDHTAAVVPFALEPELTAQLRALSRREGVTLFMTVLAAVQVVVGRLASQDDVAIGTDVAHRPHAETEGLIGLFVNELVLRTSLAGDPSVQTLLARVRATCLDAYGHQDLPFERLVEALAPARSLTRAPLFQVKLLLQNTPGASLQLPDLAVTAWETPAADTAVDLTVLLRDDAAGDGGLTGGLQYATALWTRASIAALAVRLQQVLTAMVADPAQRVSVLPLLTAPERARVLMTGTATKRAVPAATVPALIAARAAAVPDAVAVVADGSGGPAAQVSYGACWAWVTALAATLRAAGVGPEVRVAVCLDRRVELVLALVGILEAGGAYVPLDPSYPAERLAWMLADAQPALLITDAAGARRVPTAGLRVLDVDDVMTGAPAVAGPRTPGVVHPDQAAYVIYTSGSTGRPKGAINTHAALTNRLWWGQQTYCLGPDDRVLQKTPCSFDVSVWEFFWPLLAGACVVLARPEGHRDPAYLAQAIATEQITTLHFVPSMLHGFLAATTTAGPSVRRVLCSGEALSPTWRRGGWPARRVNCTTCMARRKRPSR